MFNQDGSTPIKNTGREGSYRTQGESGMRPASDPKSQKDFKKILGRDSNDEDDTGENSANIGEDGVAVGPKTEQANQVPGSVFGLSSGKGKHKELLPMGASAQTEQANQGPESLFALNSGKRKGLEPIHSEQINQPDSLFALSSGKRKESPPLDSLVPTAPMQKTPVPNPGFKSETADLKSPSLESHTSLFSLAATKESKPSEVVGSLLNTPESTDSSQAIATPHIQPSPTKDGEKKGLLSDGKTTSNAFFSAPATESKKEKFTTRFSTEQTDLSYVNLMAVNPQPIAPVEGKVDKAVMPIANIQEIVDQLIDKLYTISQTGKTDTVVVLKHPPILADAQLIVTGFDDAKGQFNISFENLTQAAKNLLDMRVNQESLLNALEQKGYAVHILTITTLVENRPIPTDNAQNQQQQGREDQNQPRDERQRRNQEEEERTA